MEADYSVRTYKTTLFDEYDIDFPHALFKAVPKRQSEFLAGRILARAALDSLGLPDASIAVGEQGSPIWPKGIAGSISHSHGKCVCLVVAGETKLVGIDVEKIADHTSLDAILLEALNGEERKLLDQQTKFDANILATLVFSAKETLFKALYPIVRRYFGFEAAIFNIAAKGNALSLSLTQSLHRDFPENTKFTVRFNIDSGFVKTWIVTRNANLLRCSPTEKIIRSARANGCL